MSLMELAKLLVLPVLLASVLAGCGGGTRHAVEHRHHSRPISYSRSYSQGYTCASNNYSISGSGSATACIQMFIKAAQYAGLPPAEYWQGVNRADYIRGAQAAVTECRRAPDYC